MVQLLFRLITLVTGLVKQLKEINERLDRMGFQLDRIAEQSTAISVEQLRQGGILQAIQDEVTIGPAVSLELEAGLPEEQP